MRSIKRICLITLGIMMGSTMFVNCSLERPKGSTSMSSSFDHTGITIACAQCHLSQRPGPNAVPAHDQTENDCSKCHNSTVPWKTTSGPHSGGIQQTACLACHGNVAGAVQPVMPVQPVSNPNPPGISSGGLFNHTVASNYNGLAKGPECLQCHAFTVSTAPVMADWNTGKFPHQVTLGACLPCHDYVNQVPSGNVTNGGVSHDHAQDKIANTDCFACHKNSGNFGKSWQTSTFDHSNDIANGTACTTCHASTAGYLTATVKNQMVHNYGGTPILGDCKACHAAAAFAAGNSPTSLNNWITESINSFADQPSKQVFHTNISGSGMTSTCSTCHGPAPGGFSRCIFNIVKHKSTNWRLILSHHTIWWRW